jgi:hypothetical protein
MPPQIDNHTLSLIISGRAQALDFDSFSPIEWNLLAKKAQKEGVAPLIYWELSRSGKLSAMPKPVANSLRATFFSTRMNNEQILKETARLVALFDQVGIPVVALKGICFALTIYPDLGLRPMVDLDLLVPAARLPEAVRIAKASGYVEPAPEALPGLDDLLDHAVGLQKRTAPFTLLELHDCLVAEQSFSHAVPVDWFWTQTLPLTGSISRPGLEKLLMLTPAAQVLYASGHAMLQHGSRNTALRWLYDFDRLVWAYQERLDWDLLLTQARIFEWSSAVIAALSQAVALFGTPVPPNVLNELSKLSDRNTHRVAMMQDPPATHTLEEFQKWKSLNWYGRIKLFIALLAPSPAYMRWRYGLKNNQALPIWYLYRWLGILKDAMKTSVLLVRNVVSYTGHRNPSRQMFR